ncbi:hypothetical protein LTR84_002374 [Exophiala bonariae]|uniref:NmrA-like domain-containing protein n=1 Tax=Exophiala bonariae TaxID=1690606 RepID=A0AAV9N9I3_9EURO|nr:hypothetical protein LTR84_002374 [Exophiala bonariae]
MPRRILITGATGNQGGSVARLLLQSPSDFTVRALTRNPNSEAAKALKEAGAEVVKGDLTDRNSLGAAFNGCWGAFVATNFYDSTITNDPASEETQGRHAAHAALQAGVECFVWSTLPSSLEISKGKVLCEIYEGKHRVDSYIQEIGLPAAFVFTGNFYENQVFRSHVVEYDDHIEFKQPIIKGDVKLHMLWVERDLAAIVKAILTRWETTREELLYQHLYAMDAVRTPHEICAIIEQGSNFPPTSEQTKHEDC